MTNGLNIAVLSRTTCWHGMHGGMDIHGKLLSKGLAARGHRVVFVCTRHPAGKTHERDSGVELYYLPDTVFGSRRHGWAKKSARSLQDLHGRNPFNLVWSQSYDGFGLISGSLDVQQLPMVSTLHGSIQQEVTTFARNLNHFWYRPDVLTKKMTGLLFSFFIAQRPVLRHSRRIVAASDRITRDLRKWFGQAAAKKCVTIHNGIDTKRFHPDPAEKRRIRARFGIHENDAVVLTLGRITHEKGHHLLLEVLAALKPTAPPIRLLVVGEGESLTSLKTRAKHLGLSDSVIFVGAVDNQETAAYYNAADIFVFPTLTVEGLPFVMLEAMACGKPVIASDIGGNAELIQNGENGILVKPGRPMIIANGIRKLIDDKSYAARLGEGALATVTNGFNLERMIDCTEQVMIEVVNVETSR